MAQQDLSSPEHRADNLSRHQFVQAYAQLRQVILDDRWANKPVSDLKLVIEVLDTQLAQKFDFTVRTLAKLFDSVTDPEVLFKTAGKPAE